MYNKKFYLYIEELGMHNKIYDEVDDNCVCYPAYFSIGERGWFLYQNPWSFTAHRIHTSVVESVEYLDNGNTIIVTTKNTKFTFEQIRSKSMYF